jgi:hypothetical protein
LAARLGPDEWQFVKIANKRGGPIRVNKEGETVTRLVDDACIFLNRPGFAKGAGCALHQAALARDERPIDWKPEVCWQVPVRRVDETDSHGHVTSTVREWKRRDWGEGGFEFHWWCTDSHEAFIGTTLVYESMREELVEMVGQKAYDLLVAHLRDREGAALPHPALKANRS